MLLLLGFAFVSGLVTILAPCIWPLLPIVLAASATGKSHTRPLGVTVGIMLSFAVFTLAISSIVRLFHFDPNVLRLFAVVFIGLLGVSLLFPSFSAVLEVAISRVSGMFGNAGQNTRNDFSGGFITGLTLGIVWSPCAGPILASIATLAATGQVTTTLIFVTFSYVLGVGIPLFLFAYGGQRIFKKTKFISRHTGRVQQVFGVIMILTALAIYTNYDKLLQADLLNAFPQFSTNLNAFESSDAVKQQLNALKGNQNQTPQIAASSGLLNTNYPAPEFTGITKWLNPEQPLTLTQLRGKVVLVDFWTYTCINCLRTLPFVTKWYDKYHDQGFVVIGVHTPEFEFEKNTDNVKNAITQYGIHYPVVQDNDYKTWGAYNNEYWPAEYLIDANGQVRRTHFGEGEYNQSEMAIKELLKEAGKSVDSSLIKARDQTPVGQMTPETYVGLSRLERFSSPETPQSGIQNYSLPSTILEHYFAFSGKWNETQEYAEPQGQSDLNFQFVADKVFLVISPKTTNAKVKVLLDDKVVSKDVTGSDVKNGYLQLDHQRLYSLIDLHGKTGSHTLRLEFENGNVQLFAFTFG